MTQVPVGRSVRVCVPASSANLGPGFDSIGLALGLWDEYVVQALSDSVLEITVSGEGAADVPTDERHLVVRTMRHTWDVLGVSGPPGLRLVATNGVPHGRGLGSSATAIVAGVVAAQGLSTLTSADDKPMSYAAGLASATEVALDLGLACHIASQLEGHPDNASASVYGGLTVSWMPDDSGLDRGAHTVTARPALHPDVEAVVFVPDMQLATKHARSVLPTSIPLAEAAANAGRAAMLVHALTTEPSELHGATRDWLHQEPRRPSYPESMELVDALRAAGHAAVISGAGPTVLVLTTRDRSDEVTAPAQMSHWDRLVPGVPTAGARVTLVD